MSSGNHSKQNVNSIPLQDSRCCTTPKPLETDSGKGVHFNPDVSVAETLSTSLRTWYTEKEIMKFKKQASDIIRRFQRKKLYQRDCLRGLEYHTSRFSASKIRVALCRDLILDEKTMFKVTDPNHLAEMLAIITTASEEEALDAARQDAQEARTFHFFENNEGKPYRCFFFNLPKWLVSSSTMPAVSDPC
jgi:hypothetical protein